MASFDREVHVKTTESHMIVDVTQDVQAAIKGSNIKDGMVMVFTPHTTTAITINENEPGLLRDLLRKYLELVPERDGYSHDRIDNNAHSHILASVIGCSQTIPMVQGRLVLGTWQSILFVELDGPRDRRMHVNAIGE